MNLDNVKFLFDNQLIAGLEKLIKDSRDYLLLVSPFIDLDSRIKDALSEKIEKSNFTIGVLFGKNEGNHLKSISPKTLEFFKQFPDIEIRYNERLHAKFYLNDFSMMLTSLNLINFSIANNIEVGMVVNYASKGRLARLIDSAGGKVIDSTEKFKSEILGISTDEEDPIDKFIKIFESAELLYKTEPILVEEEGLKGFLGAKKMTGFKVIEDKFSVSEIQRSVGFKQGYKTKEDDEEKGVFHKPEVKLETKNTVVKKLSASQLSKIMGKSSGEITNHMQQKGLIQNSEITEVGYKKGLENKTYMGKTYIVYPDNLTELQDL